MKLCFIGLGSIGNRHMRNTTAILKEYNIPYSIDALHSAKSDKRDTRNDALHKEYYSFEDMPDDYDIVYITNPTYMHYETIKQVRHKTKHMFIEKPIFESCVYELSNLGLSKNGIYYVACPLRYSSVIKHIKKIIRGKKVYSIRAISSSYLPDWRKGVDYREIYSAKKQEGGGVSLDLIHEWDYIIDLFGIPSEVYNLRGQYSELEINSDDVSIYIARYQDKLAELHLDYFGKTPMRRVELFCKDCVILADIINNKIEICGEENKTVILGQEDMYINEMSYFLNMILNKETNNNDIHHAYQVLKTALGKGSE